MLGYRHGGQSQLLPREDDWKGMAEYTPTTDTWRSVHKTVFRHTYTASSSSVDNGFTMGGWSFERTIDPYLKDAEVYFPNVDVWASRTPFLQSSAHHAATGIIGRQYVTGGIGIINSGPSGAHFFYDEDTRTWNRLIFMALRRDSHAAVASFDMEYIIGGATRSRFIGVTNNVVRSNVRTDTWADVTSHPRSIMAFSSFNLSDGVYTAGGFGDEFMGFTPETYRLSNGAWVSRQAMLDGAASGPTDQGVKL